jgi:hypothetical protein
MFTATDVIKLVALIVGLHLSWKHFGPYFIEKAGPLLGRWAFMFSFLMVAVIVAVYPVFSATVLVLAVSVMWYRNAKKVA